MMLRWDAVGGAYDELRTCDLPQDTRLRAVRAVDFDGDGDDEIVVAMDAGTPGTSAFAFAGAGAFPGALP